MRRLNIFENKPKLQKIDVSAYLELLEMVREELSLSYLKRIHRQHRKIFPYDNLDIPYGKKRRWDIQDIMSKMLLGRGGTPIEVNLAFYHLLDQLGYEVVIAEAQSGQQKSRYEHFVILTFWKEELFLCDVGWLYGIVEPKLLKSDFIQLDFNRYFTLTQDPDEQWIVSESPDNYQFFEHYTFKEEETQVIEFLNSHQSQWNDYLSTSKLLSKFVDGGWITLSDRLLTVPLDGKLEQIPILNEDEFLVKLEEYFHINLDMLLPGK